MDVLEVKEVWNKVRSELAANMPEHVFSTWIKPLAAADYENGTLVLLSPHQMGVDILKKSWTDDIRGYVRKILGENANFSLRPCSMRRGFVQILFAARL